MANISPSGHAPELTLSGAIALLIRRWWVLAALALLGAAAAWLFSATGSQSATSEVTLSVKTDHVRATWRQELERQVGVLRSAEFRQQVADATTTAGVEFDDFEIERVDAGELLVLRATAVDGPSAERAAGIAAGLAIDRSAADITAELTEEISIIESRIGLLQPSVDELNLSLIELSGQEAEVQRRLSAVVDDDAARTRLTTERNQIFDEQDLRRRERNSLADQQAQFRNRIEEIGLDLALGAATVVAVRGPSEADVTSLNRPRLVVLGTLLGLLLGIGIVAALDHRRRNAAAESESATEPAAPAPDGGATRLSGEGRSHESTHRNGARDDLAGAAEAERPPAAVGRSTTHVMGAASDTDVEDLDIDLDLDEIQQEFAAEPWVARRSVVVPDQVVNE